MNYKPKQVSQFNIIAFATKSALLVSLLVIVSPIIFKVMS